MTKKEWMIKLNTDAKENLGIGSYILYPHIEEVAELLAYHDYDLLREFSSQSRKKNSNGLSYEVMDAVISLQACFPKSRFLLDRTPIEFLVNPKGNIYFILGNCQTKLDIDCKILEYVSPAAYKICPYISDISNRKYNEEMLKGINQYFHTTFTEQDIEKIYTYLGNGCNHEKTITFIQDGFDMSMLDKEIDYEL